MGAEEGWGLVDAGLCNHPQRGSRSLVRFSGRSAVCYYAS